MQRGAGGGRRSSGALWSNIGITAFSQAAVIASGLVVYRLLSVQRGTEAFAVYVLVKQSAQFLYAFTMVGMTQALPRMVATADDSQPADQRAYVVAATLICGVPFLLVVALALLAPGLTASVAFGRSSRSDLVGALLATLGASCAFRIFYGFQRGQLRFLAASVVEFLGVAVTPLVLVLALHDSTETLMVLMGLALGVMSLAALLPTLVGGIRHARASVWVAAGELLRYGWRRVPGDAAYIALFALPTIVTAHLGSLDDVAYVNAALLVFVTLSAAVFPIGLVLLPTLTRSWATDPTEAGRFIRQLAYFALHTAIFVTPQVVLFIDVVARGWLGSGFRTSGWVLRIMVLPAGLFVGSLVLRSSLDAVAIRSYGTRAALMALTVFLVGSVGTFSLGFGRPVVDIAASFAAAMACVSLVLLYYVHRLFSLNLRESSLVPALILGAVTGGGALALRLLIAGSSSTGTIALILVAETVLAGIYVAGLWFAGVEWPRVLVKRQELGTAR